MVPLDVHLRHRRSDAKSLVRGLTGGHGDRGRSGVLRTRTAATVTGRHRRAEPDRELTVRSGGQPSSGGSAPVTVTLAPAIGAPVAASVTVPARVPVSPIGAALSNASASSRPSPYMLLSSAVPPHWCRPCRRRCR